MAGEIDITDKHTDDKNQPEPGSPEDLLPTPKPAEDSAADIVEKGEPEGGANFA